MTSPLPRGALIVADLQRGTLSGRRASSDGLLRAASAALAAARAAGLPVIHVRVAFAPGHPEVSPRNKAFAPLLQGQFMLDGSAEAAIHDAVAPIPGEPVVTKHRVGAFWATGLDQLLRASGIDHLFLAGYATSGVILTTVRDAADRDYQLTVLGDAVDDDDAGLHAMLLDRVFPRQAAVTSTAAFAAGLP